MNVTIPLNCKVSTGKKLTNQNFLKSKINAIQY